MEELKTTLVTIIGEQLKLKSPNIQYLDALNRLFCSITNYLLQKSNYILKTCGTV